MIFTGLVSGALASSSGIAGTASSIVGTASSVVDSIGGFLGFGGGNRCTEEKKQQRKTVEDSIRQYTTYNERVEFIRSTGSSTNRIKPTPEGMAFFYLGEDDCYHRNVSEKHSRFINNLPNWIQGKANEKSNQTPANQPEGTGGVKLSALLPIAGILASAFIFKN
jgi:hypothetical protein